MLKIYREPKEFFGLDFSFMEFVWEKAHFLTWDLILNNMKRKKHKLFILSSEYLWSIFAEINLYV